LPPVSEHYLQTRRKVVIRSEDAMSQHANPPKHFSMIRGFHLADFFTLGNAACGTVAVFLAMIYADGELAVHFFIAAAMAPAHPANSGQAVATTAASAPAAASTAVPASVTSFRSSGRSFTLGS